MRTRRPALVLAALLLVPAGLSGCGDDGDDGADTTTTTTEAEATSEDGATTSAPEDGATTTEAPEDGTTTEGGSTTSPNLPPNDSPLAELLLDPAVVGPGYAPDDTLGDGSLDTDLCERVTLEANWEDEAAQALLAGTAEDSAIFQQSILRFADAEAAGFFALTLGGALTACQPGTETVELEGIGDGAVLVTAPSTETTSVAGIVRVGDLVGWHLGITGPDTESPVDEDLLAASAELLAG